MTEPNAGEPLMGAVPPPTPMPPHGHVPPAKPHSSSRGLFIGCLVLIAAAACVVVLLVVAVVLLFSGAIVGAGAQGSIASEGPRIQEVTISGKAGMPKVVVIPVQGLLARGGGPMGSHDPADTLKAMLDSAQADPKVAAILLEVDSPGGAMTTCDIMYKYLREYKQETGKPVVALMYDVAASGGYYVSCAADRIVAHRTTLTGSIGVLMPMMDASGLLRMVGVSDRTIKSGAFKDMGSPFATKTDQERRAEDAVFQSIVQDMYDRFVEVVAEGRGMSDAQVRKLADGRVYTSRQALENGLIDALGYEEDAIGAATQLAGKAQVEVVRYERMHSLLEMLFARANASSTNAALDMLPAMTSPRPMYLWCPQAAELP